MPAENRQNIRFKAFNSASVLIRSKNIQERGFLIDISKAGASFEYAPGREISDTFIVDIISYNRNFRIERIPCRTVFETELKKENHLLLKVRRIGVRFDTLTSSQFSDLVDFINEYLDYPAPVGTIEANPFLEGERALTKLGSSQSGQLDRLLNLFNKRRMHSRKPCEIAVNYGTRFHAFEDVIKNISLGGVYIETRMPLPIDQGISMNFRLPKSDKLFHASGEIIWADLQGIGVKFRSTVAKENATDFNDLETNREKFIRIKQEVKKMGRIKKKMVHWQPSTSSDVTGYRIYWSNKSEVDYNSTYVQLGNVTEIILPDDISSFPIEKGKIELGISAINQDGNESDITKITVNYNFTIPSAPKGFVVEDL